MKSVLSGCFNLFLKLSILIFISQSYASPTLQCRDFIRTGKIKKASYQIQALCGTVTSIGSDLIGIDDPVLKMDSNRSEFPVFAWKSWTQLDETEKAGDVICNLFNYKYVEDSATTTTLQNPAETALTITRKDSFVERNGYLLAQVNVIKHVTCTLPHQTSTSDK